uniref:Uncharacterized protein n=1 Tax=Anguilla anguilla TaxID=7936 RepID=A0A0E9VG70_ANGAN
MRFRSNHRITYSLIL